MPVDRDRSVARRARAIARRRHRVVDPSRQCTLTFAARPARLRVAHRDRAEGAATSTTISIFDGDDLLTFSFADVERYHGQGSIGGAALGFKALEAGLGALFTDGPGRRDDVSIVSGHGGPGVRDAFELVTRAVTRGALRVDTSRADGHHNPFSVNAYSFEITSAARGSVDLVLHAGAIPFRFYELWNRLNTGVATPAERAELNRVKRSVADDLLARRPDELFRIALTPRRP